jgi:hypothetical protein
MRELADLDTVELGGVLGDTEILAAIELGESDLAMSDGKAIQTEQSFGDSVRREYSLEVEQSATAPPRPGRELG